MENSLRNRTKKIKEIKKMINHHEKKLFNDEETTEWHRETFIKSEYRKHNSTFWQCLKSLFYLHNQSFNVWSHILVSLYFLVHFPQTLSEDTHPIFDPFNLPMLSAGFPSVFSQGCLI